MLFLSPTALPLFLNLFSELTAANLLNSCQKSES